MDWNDGGRVAIAHGARSAEADLIDSVLESARFDPQRGFPDGAVRVIVPSRSLREHLSTRLVARGGGATAGLIVQTLRSVVSTILDTATSRGLESAQESAVLFGVLVRQLAAREPALRASLDDLRDGYASVEADVSDLLDAGFEPAHMDAVLEQLQESPGGSMGGALSRLAEESRASRNARERESEWAGSWERACALVRVAAAAAEMRTAAGIGHASAQVVVARDWLESDPEAFLPASAIFVFGFADVTGVQTDLIEAMVRRCGARVMIDVPRDPVERDRIDSGAVFTQRFVDRMRAASAESAAIDRFDADPIDASLIEANPTSIAPTDSARDAVVRVLHAPGSAAELRAVAVRVRGLLDAGERPEGIAVVARTLDGYRSVLRTHFHRLAIPFSGVGERAVATAVTRRHSSLLALLRDGARAPVDRWIDVLHRLGRGRPLSLGDRANLRSAFHAIGIGRLEQIAGLEDESTSTAATSSPSPSSQSTSNQSTSNQSTSNQSTSEPSPSQPSLFDPSTFDPSTFHPSTQDDDDPKRATQPVRPDERDTREGKLFAAARRFVSVKRARSAAASAGALLDHMASWPRRASLAEHLRALRTLVQRELGWRSGEPAFDELERAVFAAWASESASESAKLAFDRDDFVRLVERCLSHASTELIGGNGGGVAVLSAMEARSRTFEHLFVIGLSSDVFPRAISEDPLLPDALRRRLRVVLPDMPVKREGADEERYLFAQLLSSSPDVVLSCPIADENGKPIPVSPLLERFKGIAPIAVPGLLQAGDTQHTQASRSAQRSEGIRPSRLDPLILRPAHEHALIAGLYGTRDQFRSAFRIAIAETGGASREMSLHERSLADSRVAVLSEWRNQESVQLGPYFGFVGPVTEKTDPRLAPLFITNAEKIAACPWNAFVSRLLGVEPVPDACVDLPSADARLVGGLVHDALQDWATDALLRAGADPEIDDLAGLATQAPVAILWPSERAQWELLLRCAEVLTAKSGIHMPGFSRVLAARAQGHLAVLRENADSGSPSSSRGIIGVEVFGVARMQGEDREIRFRADRVDRSLDCGLTLIDYKTGKPLAKQKSEAARSEALRKQMARGASLQAGAYAIAAEQITGVVGTGEYLHLDPNAPDHARSITTRSDNEDFVRVFEQSIEKVFEVIERGSFFPRLVDAASGVEPRKCLSCEVKESCIRGDTGARRRLERWVSDRNPETPEEVAFVNMWMIGEDEP